MAKIDDIDTTSAVSKFLQQRSVVDREDPASDASDEIQAVLESVALSFLLYPQAALSFVLQAKNIFQTIISADLSIVSYILDSIADIDNPNIGITDTGHLIDAQIALVEVDRVGRISSDVQAYSRYSSAINKFLDGDIARSVKRNNKNEFERTGAEARQDILAMLSSFISIHSLMISTLQVVADSVNNFESVNLTKLVAPYALSRVRNSLDKVVRGIQSNQLSNTAVSIELLAGASSLSSISNARSVYDPTIQTGSFPVNSDIVMSSELVAASAIGTDQTISLGLISPPWIFDITVDPNTVPGTTYSVTIPHSGASGRAYVKASSGSATYNIVSGTDTLYVQFDGIAPSTGGSVLLSKMVVAVTLPPGSITFNDVLTALNDVSTGLLYGTAVELAPNTNRLLIYGSSSVTSITILPTSIGSFDIGGNYIPPSSSIHRTLGFSDQQTSTDPLMFSPIDMADILGANIPTVSVFVNNDNKLQITSDLLSLQSSLSFGSGIASSFGFSTTSVYTPKPSYLELRKGSEVQDPASLGVFVGSRVSVDSFIANIESIDGTKLEFAVDVPNVGSQFVTVTAPVVYTVQSLLSLLVSSKNLFDSDIINLQRVLSPVLSNPTLAQINDAKTALTAVKAKIQNLLTQIQAFVLRDDQMEFSTIAKQISAALEERGLDRALELLQNGKFSDFFGVSNVQASKGARFLTATEDLGRNDLTSITVEQDIPDLKPKGTSPNILTPAELTENEDPQ